MESKDLHQTIDELKCILTLFEAKALQLLVNGEHYTRTIYNVQTETIVQLYNELGGMRAIYLPGEIGTETLVLEYAPCKGFTVFIESEQCVIYKPKQITFSLN
jgi:hypothetical protein